jgi:hypothetical protein
MGLDILLWLPFGERAGRILADGLKDVLTSPESESDDVIGEFWSSSANNGVDRLDIQRLSHQIAKGGSGD